MTLAASICISVDEDDFSFYRADLDHLATAVKALKKEHRYTAAERVDRIREFVTAHFRDDEN
jgi:hypothetical protein